MKKRIFWLTVIFLSCSLNTFVAAEDSLKMYAFKSAIYEMKMTGSMMQGTTQGYIDDFGNKEARYETQTVSVFGIGKTTETMELREGYVAYNVDLAAKIATKMDIREATEVIGGKEGMQNIRDFSEKGIESFGGKKLKSEKILGKQCDVYFFESYGMTVWVYKNFPMKMMVNMMGISMTTEAVRFDENVRVPAEKMLLPEGLTIEDAPDVKETMSKLQAMKESGELKRAMADLNTMQKSSEFQEAMQQLQTVQQSGEYQQAIQQSQVAAQQYSQQVVNSNAVPAAVAGQAGLVPGQTTTSQQQAQSVENVLGSFLGAFAKQRQE